jgi:hypothetical protein
MNLAEKLSAALDDYRPPAGTRVSHPIEFMYKRGTLAEELYRAAQAFKADWECASGLSSAPIVNWEAFFANALTDNPLLQEGRPRSSPRVTRVPNGPQQIVDARKELARLRWCVGGLGFQILRAVCGLGIPVQAVSQLLGVHRDVVSLRLREGLYDAAQFYGLDGSDK